MARLAGLILLLVLALPTPLRAESENPEPRSVADEVVFTALSLLGVNYSYGGRDPTSGLDCSGLVRHVFQQAAGLMLPHNALAISRLGRSVRSDDLVPGDLVFFDTLKSAFSHVGVYIGDNRFVHASSRRGGSVEIAEMGDRYWRLRFNGARRLMPE